ncbi:TPA: hypothetical protein QFF28_000178 [Enterococcus faecium]|uniref:hypothetical protein n=1 Tax=Enterococcus faecium TaxID=1352 RepID=UPI0021E945D7|nr:hypothetical protein [Enterococcus faecium]MCV3202868.1 hypothetical protein [Enterococcus faecium]MCV6663019.1 hypothetical protein [Enterococcus faecium]
MLIKKEAGTEAFNSKKLAEIHENCFSNFCEFQLISKGVASASAVYTCLERETKVFFTFVPRSFSE